MSGTFPQNKKVSKSTSRPKNKKAGKSSVRSSTKVSVASPLFLPLDNNSLPSVSDIVSKSKSSLEKVESKDTGQYTTTNLPLRPAMEPVTSTTESIASPSETVISPTETVIWPFSADIPSLAHAHLVRREFTKKLGKYGYITYDAETRTYAVEPGYKIITGRNGKERLVINNPGGRGGAISGDTIRERIKANDGLEPTTKQEAAAKENRRLVLLKDLQERKAANLVGEDEDDLAPSTKEMVDWVMGPVEGWLNEKA